MDWTEQRIINLERICAPLARRVDRVLEQIGQVDQFLQGVRSGGSLPGCEVDLIQCPGNPVPCSLKIEIALYLVDPIQIANQVVALEWQGEANPYVWSGCAILPYTPGYQGTCESGSTPVRVTLDMTDGLDEDNPPKVLIQYKIVGSCPVPGTCEDLVTNSGLQYSSVVVACDPFSVSFDQTGFHHFKISKA